MQHLIPACTPWISALCPEESSLPAFDPVRSRKASFTGAAVPGTPLMRVVPDIIRTMWLARRRGGGLSGPTRELHRVLAETRPV